MKGGVMSTKMSAYGLATIALVVMVFHVLFVRAQSGEQESEKATVERTLHS
jgi:hypothetical protein